MLSEISYPEFVEWRKFAELEPFDELRQDLRTASIVQAIASVFSSRKKALTDYLLPFGDARKFDKTWQDLKMLAKQSATAFNDKTKPGRKKKHG